MGIFLRGGVFHYRKVIPAKLRVFFPRPDAAKGEGGRRELVVSLRTGDRAKATLAALEVMHTIERQLQEAKRRLATVATGADALAADALRVGLADDAAIRAAGQSPLQADGRPTEDDELAQMLLSDAQDALENGETARVADRLQELARSLNIALPADTKPYTTALLRADVEHATVVLRREQGQPVAESMTVTGLAEAWATAALSRGIVARTVAERKTFAAELALVCGATLPVASITKAHVRQFHAALTTSTGRSGKVRESGTVRKMFASVAALFSWAEEVGHIEKSPFFKLAASAPHAGNGETEEDKSFTDAELAALFAHRLFASPILTPNGSAKGGVLSPAARYWLPVLALYTGCRANELAGLRVADVKAAEGVTFLDVIAHEGRRLKNASSRRRIPIHSELARLGFLAFVEAVKAHGGDRLFPGLTSANYSASFNALRTEVEVSRKTFHSYRHTWKTAARRGGVEEQYSDALTGHRNGSVGRKYGAVPLTVLAEQMERITYTVKLTA